MNRYLWYNLTHKQIPLVINNYFKFDTVTGKLVSQREQFCFCTYTYQHQLENLSYQTHAKLWALKSSCEGTFSTKRLSETIVACGALRVNMYRISPIPSTTTATNRYVLFYSINKLNIHYIMSQANATSWLLMTYLFDTDELDLVFSNLSLAAFQHYSGSGYSSARIKLADSPGSQYVGTPPHYSCHFNSQLPTTNVGGGPPLHCSCQFNSQLLMTNGVGVLLVIAYVTNQVDCSSAVKQN